MKRPLVRAAALAAAAALLCVAPSSAAEAPRKGMWITCIGPSDVLGSREGVEKAVAFAKKAGFKMLFVQVYRADKAWFDSKVADASPYQKNLKAAKTDTFRLLIDRAHTDGIEVHAWINTLTLSQSEDAKLIRQHGREVLTKDQHGRPAFSKTKDDRDKRYEREQQLFLEPGDWRVRERVITVVKELATNYPKLDGIHFDYIRYPAAPPYIPGSKFGAVGLHYGFGERNVKRFQEKSGIDPHRVDWKPEAALVWDDWKRQQVTSLITDAAREARASRPGIKISAAVLAAFDRAYQAACQEWPLWAEKGIVDFVVLMNYSKDAKYVRLLSKAAQGLVGASKVYVGLGAWLMDKEPALLGTQIRQNGSPLAGVILFDYDSISSTPALKNLVVPQGSAS